MIQETFNEGRTRLPTNKELKEFVLCEDDHYTSGDLTNRNIFEYRDAYVKFSFPILSDEFVLASKDTFDKLNIETVVELACGAGWLSYWFKKYGINIVASVDNKSWIGRNKKGFSWRDDIVIGDAVECVEGNPHIDMFILSWPYMDPLAYRIWEEMEFGQYLFYIGECEGGCTADDSFFNAVRSKSVDHTINPHFLSFWGLHDRIEIYKK